MQRKIQKTRNYPQFEGSFGHLLKNIRPPQGGKSAGGELRHNHIVLAAGAVADQQLTVLPPAYHDPHMGIVRVEGQITGLGLLLRNGRTVGVLGGGIAAPTMCQSNQCAYRKKSPQIEETFCTSKTAPDRSRAVKEALCVITILRLQIPEPFPGTGKKQFAFQRRPGLVCLHQLVHPEGAGITGRLQFLNITVKVVGMEGAEQAAACLRLQASYLLIVSVAHGMGPAHFHQRIAVGEQGQFALSAPVALFPHDPHVHIVGVQIQGQVAGEVCNPVVFVVQTFQLP